MLERQFATKFRSELKEYCGSVGMPIHLVTLYDAPRSGKKPYDSYMLTDKKFCALEFKSCTGASFAMNSVSERQVNSLTEVAKCRGNAKVIIHISRTNQVVVINIKDFKKLLKTHQRIQLAEFSILCQQMLVTLLERKKCKIGDSSVTRWEISKVFHGQTI